MKIDYASLPTKALVIYPRLIVVAHSRRNSAPQSFFDSGRDPPVWVGEVPNFADFAVGPDHDVSAFDIKQRGTDRAYLPSSLADLLPNTALIMDDLYAHTGKDDADQCEVSLQFRRRGHAPCEPLLFDPIHRHVSEGKTVLSGVTACDRAGTLMPQCLSTEFYAAKAMGKCVARPQTIRSPKNFEQRFREEGVVAAPGGAIIRFSETTLCAAPDIIQNPTAGRIAGQGFGDKGLYRSNIIAIPRLPDGTVFGRTRPPQNYRPAPIRDPAARHDAYPAAADCILPSISQTDFRS